MKGLKVLHDAGMFFGHLHASNVVVDDGVCRLVDVENGILGVPSFLRAAFTQHRKINVCTLPPSLLPSGPDRTGHRWWRSLGCLLLSPQSMEAVDVFGFGHLLYEMTYGRPPHGVPVNDAPAVPCAAIGQCVPTRRYKRRVPPTPPPPPG